MRVAEPPCMDQKSVAGMSSPEGEETGEGELNSRERSERHFLCCSFVGELFFRGRQPVLIWPSMLMAKIRVNSC